jgi:hypothetical protein
MRYGVIASAEAPNRLSASFETEAAIVTAPEPTRSAMLPPLPSG